ncbi:hypothetical protein LDENG_00055530 [Lucifuga dentata]|nr:hypothetical protein LDENG_00055530 [Lucifuga dentata]
MEVIIHAFILSRLDYYNSLFNCLNKSSLNRLPSFQNAAARLLTNSRNRSHITPILKSLHWLPVSFKTLVLMFKALHGKILQLLQTCSSCRSFRSSEHRLLF